MTGASTDRSHGGLKDWSTKDLLVVAAIAVALGLVLVPVNYALGALFALSLLIYALFTGAYFLPCLASMYIVRHPGAALVGGIFAGLVQVRSLRPGG